jgi:hypothetical protein
LAKKYLPSAGAQRTETAWKPTASDNEAAIISKQLRLAAMINMTPRKINMVASGVVVAKPEEC